MTSEQVNRALTEAEHSLARWMLEHGIQEAQAFLPQLELAEVTPWKCSCGCASLDFQIKGQPEAPPGVHILGDYLVAEGDRASGAFIFESGGLLSGLEVYGSRVRGAHCSAERRGAAALRERRRSIADHRRDQTAQKQRKGRRPRASPQ